MQQINENFVFDTLPTNFHALAVNAVANKPHQTNQH